ncbi:hypothetical protein Hypma_006977 [Hypsizygus marmoreus]|uniref:Uncharacterized protein n=1 Tax=Hypsizygus marmoreus TaxID=39966 RepID=A0A369JWF0_HYPMA|nr:hypothetical protein Hypma_006977 [Hypsizygus marmoreus]
MSLSAQSIYNLLPTYPCILDFPLGLHQYIVSSAPEARQPQYWTNFHDYTSLKHAVAESERFLMSEQNKQVSAMKRAQAKFALESPALPKKGETNLPPTIHPRLIPGINPLAIREAERRYISLRRELTRLELEILNFEVQASERRFDGEQNKAQRFLQYEAEQSAIPPQISANSAFSSSIQKITAVAIASRPRRQLDHASDLSDSSDDNTSDSSTPPTSSPSSCDTSIASIISDSASGQDFSDSSYIPFSKETSQVVIVNKYSKN